MTRPQFGQCGIPILAVEKSQIVINLPVTVPTVDRGLRLVDFSSRLKLPAEGLQCFLIRLLHLPQELPCIRRKRLHIAPLSFRIIVSKARELLPNPESPVKTTSSFRDVNVQVLRIILIHTAIFMHFFSSIKKRLHYPWGLSTMQVGTVPKVPKGSIAGNRKEPYC